MSLLPTATSALPSYRTPKIYRRMSGKDRHAYTVSMFAGPKRIRLYCKTEAEASALAATCAGLLLAGEQHLLDFVASRKAAADAAREAARPVPVAPPAPAPAPVSALADAILSDLEAKAAKEDKHRRHAETVRSHFLRLRKAFGSRSVQDLTTEEIDAYLRKISANAKTRNNHLGSLGLLFAAARRAGHVSSDNAVSRIPRFAEPVRTRQVYTPEEMLRLLAAADVSTLPMLAICGFAGVRSAEVVRMLGSNYNATEGCLVLGPEVTKTNRRRIVNVEPNLAGWLAVVAASPETRFVANPDIHRRLRRVASAAGVRLIPNGLRVSYISYHLEKFRNISLTAKHAGNSASVAETEYLHLAPKSQADEWFEIFPKNVLDFAATSGLPIPDWNEEDAGVKEAATSILQI